MSFSQNKQLKIFCPLKYPKFNVISFSIHDYYFTSQQNTEPRFQLIHIPNTEANFNFNHKKIRSNNNSDLINYNTIINWHNYFSSFKIDSKNDLSEFIYASCHPETISELSDKIRPKLKSHKDLEKTLGGLEGTFNWIFHNDILFNFKEFEKYIFINNSITLNKKKVFNFI